jgi:hypothetical protein
MTSSFFLLVYGFLSYGFLYFYSIYGLTLYPRCLTVSSTAASGDDRTVLDLITSFYRDGLFRRAR